MQATHELELPLRDDPGDLTHRRLGHLAHVPGVDAHTMLRLARTYPSLAAIYAAPESELTRVIGDVAAARVRWFLDAPLVAGAFNVG